MIHKASFLLFLILTQISLAKADTIDSLINKAFLQLATAPDSAFQSIESFRNQIQSYDQHDQKKFYQKAASFYSQIGAFDREADHLQNEILLHSDSPDSAFQTMVFLGMAYLNSGRTDLARNCFRWSEKYFFATSDLEKIVSAYSGLASVYTVSGRSIDAIDYYFKAIQLLEQTENYLTLAKTYSNLSILYVSLGEKQKALDVRKKAYNFAVLSGDPEEIHFEELNLGGSYNSLDQADSALFYLKKSEVYFEEHFNAQILNAIYNEIGSSYSKTGKNDEAEEYYLKSIQLLKTGGFDFALPGTMGNYGLVLHAKKEFSKGISVCREALPIAKRIQYPEVEMVVCNCLYKNYKAIHQADSALFYYEHTLLLKDSLDNAELQKASLRKELEKEYTLEKEGIISSAARELDEVVSLRNVLLIGSSILLIALLILFISFYQKKKAVTFVKREKEYLDNLIHNLVHEFRTPLTLIKGPAEELLKTDRSNAFLQLINKNGEHMLHLVNQVLDFSRIKAGKMSLSPEPTDLPLFITGIKDMFTPLAAGKNIRLTYTNRMEQTIVSLDSDKLLKILSNLVSNAIKYSTENTSVSITSSLEEGQIVITVADTGIGIPLREQENIFKKYYQIDSTTTRKETGTGIGLAFVKELVQLMKGKIELNSVLKQGTTVKVYFPYEPVNLSSTVSNSSDSLKPVQQNPAITSESNEEKPKVLIIEDNPDLRLFLQLLLEKEGYELYTATDGEDGIEQAIALIPDVIISDVMMPRKDGLEVLKVLKNDPVTEHVPIIMLTAKSSFDSMISGLQSGADDYIAKPFQSEELVLRVTNQIRLQLKLQQRFQSSDGVEKESAPKHNLILKIETLIREEEGVHLSVEDVADRCAISRSQLHRKIKQLTGLSTTALLTKIRLDLSVSDLTQTDLSISEISYKYGYSDPANFSRLFKKQFNQSPSEYRNSKG